MIQSMTGYGKSILQLPSKKITIELKSLNSKNLDLNSRVPSKYREKEIQIRRQLAKELVRGKIDISLFIEATGEELTTKINKEIIIDGGKVKFGANITKQDSTTSLNKEPLSKSAFLSRLIKNRIN